MPFVPYHLRNEKSIDFSLDIRKEILNMRPEEREIFPPPPKPKPPARFHKTGNPVFDGMRATIAIANRKPTAASGEFVFDAGPAPFENAICYNFIAPNSNTQHNYIVITTGDEITLDQFPARIANAAFAISHITAEGRQQARTDMLFRLDPNPLNRGIIEDGDGGIGVFANKGQETAASRKLFWTAAAIAYHIHKETGTRWRIIPHHRTLPANQRWRALTLNPTADNVQCLFKRPFEFNTLYKLHAACNGYEFQRSIGYDDLENDQRRQFNAGRMLANIKKGIMANSAAQEVFRLRNHGLTLAECAERLGISERQAIRYQSSWK